MKKFTKKDAQRIGDKLKLDWSKYDIDQFTMGLNVELEHGLIDPNTNITNDDEIKTAKVAIAHLNELKDYYTRLEAMENDSPSHPRLTQKALNIKDVKSIIKPLIVKLVKSQRGRSHPLASHKYIDKQWKNGSWVYKYYNPKTNKEKTSTEPPDYKHLHLKFKKLKDGSIGINNSDIEIKPDDSSYDAESKKKRLWRIWDPNGLKDKDGKVISGKFWETKFDNLERAKVAISNYIEKQKDTKPIVKKCKENFI